MEPAKKQGGIKDIALGRSDTFRLDPRILKVRPGWNCRVTDFDPEDEEDMRLARSIAANGVLEPVTVVMVDGEACLTNGHRRRAATMYAIEVLGADIKSVPAQTVPKYTSDADHVADQLNRNSGKLFSPYEKGTNFKRLMAFGWTEADIAARSGISEKYVTQILTLHGAPESVQALVRSGEVSATLAIHTVQTAETPQQATEDLQAAVVTAKAAGKARATAKHLPSAPQRGGLKADLRDLVEAATRVDGDGIVSLVFTSAEHARLLALAGL